MRRFSLTVLLLVIWCWNLHSLHAWSDTGHKVVASIAWRQIKPAQQQAIIAILKEHPRYQQEFLDRMPNEIQTGEEKLRHEWLIQQAAVWPDIAREYKDEVRAAFHRGVWHYVNHAYYLKPDEAAELSAKQEVSNEYDAPETPDKILNVIQCMRFTRRELLPNSSAKPSDRAVWLCWLFHTVGDIHQPLHASTMFSKELFPLGDQGGNLILLTKRENLHGLWDSFPGGKCSAVEARNDALKLLIDEALLAHGHAAEKQLDEEVWMRESQQLALTVVYTDEVVGPLRKFKSAGELRDTPLGLSSEYMKNGGAVSRQRLMEAGFRMGAILQQIAPAK